MLPFQANNIKIIRKPASKLYLAKNLILSLTLLCFIFAFNSCWKAKIIGGPVNHAALKDGVYEGESSHGPNSVKVRVTVKDQKISLIEVLKNKAWKGKKALSEIPNRIIQEQSTKVDALSGATNTSNVIMNAVENALSKALLNS